MPRCRSFVITFGSRREANHAKRFPGRKCQGAEDCDGKLRNKGKNKIVHLFSLQHQPQNTASQSPPTPTHILIINIILC